MKLTALILPLVVGTMALAADAPPIDAATETHISSDSVEFDMKTRLAIYRGNVRVQDPRITMTCEYLTAKVPAGGRVDSIIAETNVVATIVTNNTTFTITSAKATYTYQVLPFATNQTLELTGLPLPKISWPQEDVVPPGTNEFTARRILWDLGRGSFRAEEQRGVFPDMETLKKRVPIPKVAPATNSQPTTP